MSPRIRITISFAALLLILCGPGIGHAGDAAADSGSDRTIQTGDLLDISYTCRLPDGAIAATNREGVDGDPSQKKAFIYARPKDFSTRLITAGQGLAEPDVLGFRSFEAEREGRIARALVGRKTGVTETLRISSPEDAGLGDDRYLKLALSYTVPKVKNLVPELFRKINGGKEPKVGDRTEQPGTGFVHTVLSVTEKTIQYRMDVIDGAVTETPWGPGRMYNVDDKYFRIVHQVSVGQMVRSGPLVGKIIKIDDQFFHIDFGSPFGGAELVCEVFAQPHKADGGGQAVGNEKEGEGENAKSRI
ncbi:MAG: hypothetical protein AB1568_05040 [Thermodesulfobacteriota bacterium]